MSVGQNSLPVLSFGAGAGLAPGVESLPNIEAHLLFVDQGDNAAPDGSRQEPFHTVAAALTAAAALVPAADNRVMILIYPGEYNEDGLTSVDYVDMVGVGGRGAVRIEGTDTVIVVQDENTSYWNITFAVTAGVAPVVLIDGSSGAFSDQAEFHDCVFDMPGTSSAHAVTIQDGADAFFVHCEFDNGNLVAVATTDPGDVEIRSCVIIGGTTFNGSIAGTGNVVLDTCIISINAAAIYPVGMPTTSLATMLIKDCTIANAGGDCIYIGINPASSLAIVGNRLTAAAGSYDITATSLMTGLIVRNNVMTRGMDDNISHIDPTRNVGAAGHCDWYGTIPLALATCTFDDIVVNILTDQTITAALTPPSYNIVIRSIDKNSITRAAGSPIMTIGAADNVTFYSVVLVGSLDVNGNGAILRLLDCELTGLVDIQSGNSSTEIFVRGTSIIGDATDQYCVRFADADPYIYIEDSYLKGDAGDPAIYWDSGVTNDNLYMRRTRCFHGDLGANNPFGRNAAQTPDWYGHHDSFNVEPDATGGWSTNQIAAAQQYHTIDVNADYD